MADFPDAFGVVEATTAIRQEIAARNQEADAEAERPRIRAGLAAYEVTSDDGNLFRDTSMLVTAERQSGMD